MQDKSFEDAMRELEDRLTGEIEEHMDSRLDALPGNTVSSLVTDIANPQMRASVTDILCMIKIVTLLNTLVSMDFLKKAEWQELKDYIDQLHKRSRQADRQTP